MRTKTLLMLAILLNLSCETALQQTYILDQKTKTLETMKRIRKIDLLFREILDKRIPFCNSANSIEELTKDASSDSLKEVPGADSWGNNLLFFFDQCNNEYGIASSGNDGKFNGWKQRGFYNGDILCGYKNDIILINGKFVFGPDARPERNSPKLVAPALKLFVQGDLNGCTKLLESIQRKYPFNLYANVYLGASYFFLGRNLDAIGVLMHAKRHFPKNSEIDIFLSLSYCEIDNMRESIKYLLLSNYNFDEDNYSLTGITAFLTEINYWINNKENDFIRKEESHKEIIDYYETLAHFPHYSQLYAMIFYQLGVIQSNFKNFSSAIYFFEKSISFGKPDEIFYLKSRLELSRLSANVNKSKF